MSWFIDTLERVLVTFAEAWIAAWLAIPNPAITDATVFHVALVAAVVAFGKCLVATRIGSQQSASLAA